MRRRTPILLGPDDQFELQSLTLSSNTVESGSPEDTLVGVLIGRTTGSTLSLEDDASGRFKLVGITVYTGSTPTNYDDATSHQITVRETHDFASNSPRDSNIIIDVLPSDEEPVTLQPLTLSNDTIQEGAVEDTFVGTLIGVTSGSTLSLEDDAGGRFKLVGNSIYTGPTPTDYNDATSHQITVREEHDNATNSPNDTNLTIHVIEAPAHTDAELLLGNEAGLAIVFTDKSAIIRDEALVNKAEKMLENESEGFAIAFDDDYHFMSTGKYGSAVIKEQE